MVENFMLQRPMVVVLPGGGSAMVQHFEVGEARPNIIGEVTDISPSPVGVTVETTRYVIGITMLGTTVEKKNG